MIMGCDEISFLLRRCGGRDGGCLAVLLRDNRTGGHRKGNPVHRHRRDFHYPADWTQPHKAQTQEKEKTEEITPLKQWGRRDLNSGLWLFCADQRPIWQIIEQ